MEERRKRISIIIPSSGYLPAAFLQNFVRVLSRGALKYDIDVDVPTMCPLDEARNQSVKAALSSFNPTYILFWDSDNIIPDDAIEKFLFTMEKSRADIVTGLYFERNKPYFPVLKKEEMGGFFRIEDVELGKVLEVDCAGLGCVMIRADVFRNLSYPWFRFTYEKWGERDFMVSEDTFFFRKAKNARMRVVCDTRIVSPHYGAFADVPEYLGFEAIRRKAAVDREEFITGLMEFLGLTKEEAVVRGLSGRERLRDEWNAAKPEGMKAVKRFYTESENVLYDAYATHFEGRRQFDGMVSELRALGKVLGRDPNILVFGPDVAVSAYIIAKEGFPVTACWFDGGSLNFAAHMLKKTPGNFDIWNLDGGMAPDVEFDVIVAIGTFELIPAAGLQDVVEALLKVRKKESRVFLTNSYGATGERPMKMDFSEEHARWVGKLLSG